MTDSTAYIHEDDFVRPSALEHMLTYRKPREPRGLLASDAGLEKVEIVKRMAGRRLRLPIRKSSE